MNPASLSVTLLLTAWDDLDRAVADVSETDMLRQIDGGSCFAWTLAHVTYGVDSWINRRFQQMPLNPILSNPRYDYGGDGGEDDWPTIRAAVTDARDRLRPFLLNLSESDLELTLPYDGSYAPFRERGINLRIAIVQNAIHHVFHLGEIVAKRELMGYNTGSFPGAFGAALMSMEYYQ
ncbi:MAG: DinB family protein [Chloroflexota bacterium]|nr:DinB family protein [Chloroflexota bacterium]